MKRKVMLELSLVMLITAFSAITMISFYKFLVNRSAKALKESQYKYDNIHFVDSLALIENALFEMQSYLKKVEPDSIYRPIYFDNDEFILFYQSNLKLNYSDNNKLNFNKIKTISTLDYYEFIEMFKIIKLFRRNKIYSINYNKYKKYSYLDYQINESGSFYYDRGILHLDKLNKNIWIYLKSYWFNKQYFIIDKKGNFILTAPVDSKKFIIKNEIPVEKLFEEYNINLPFL